MENTYGIGIANRYDMFYDQDDVTEFETVITKKKEKKSKEPAQQTQAASPAVGVQKSTAEKENKQVKKALDNGAGQKPTPDQQRRGIKEQQNNSNKDNSQRKDGDNKGFSNNNPRPAFNKPGDREERNNRRNREMNGNVDFEKPRTGGNGSAVGPRNQNRTRNFAGGDGRKRERDRQSGSDKTGVKSVDKRDGGGAHNWGNPKQDIDDMNKATTDDENKEGGEEVVEDSATPAAPVEEEPKEMTLDEWKAQRKLLQPTYNLRKAGEGEDNAQWDKMKRLDKKSEDGDVGRKDDGTSAKKDEQKKKQVLDIEFHFNDGRRGGLGRRGGPGAGGRGGPGGQSGQNRRPRPERGPRENNAEESHSHGEARGGGGGGGGGGEGANTGGEHRERRPPRRPRFENRRDFHGNDAQNAPKVDDERDFPSLG